MKTSLTVTFKSLAFTAALALLPLSSPAQAKVYLGDCQKEAERLASELHKSISGKTDKPQFVRFIDVEPVSSEPTSGEQVMNEIYTVVFEDDRDSFVLLVSDSGDACRFFSAKMAN